MRCTFSVMLSIVRSFRIGTSTFGGMMEVGCFLSYGERGASGEGHNYKNLARGTD
jgi:hypothetical protein